VRSKFEKVDDHPEPEQKPYYYKVGPEREEEDWILAF
jgi:hypothetical protein